MEAPAALKIWTHVAGVYDGSSLKIDVNGALKASVPASGVMQPSNQPIVIGNHPSSNAFKGKIDEVRLYEEALSATQIAELAAVPSHP